MNGRTWRAALLVAALAAAAPARAQGAFGPQTAMSWAPELDAYWQLADGGRLQLQVIDQWTPAAQNNQVSVGIIGAWLVADVLRDLLTPDRAKTHALDLRLGVLYNATTQAGTIGPGNIWTLRLELTPRYNLPLGVLASVRNRLTANWAVDGASGFYFRWRVRPQLEREFAIGEVALTPYANFEFFWQSPPAMWTQFRLQAGLQAGFQAFGRGQTVEVNYVAITSLQPARSWSPQVGVVLSTYL